MLSLEVRKLLQYKTAAGILALYAVLFFLYVLQGYQLSQPPGQDPALTYAFPLLWTKLASTASLFSLLLVILFLILTTDDFQYRIFRQQLIDGASYAKLIQIKFIDGLLLIAFATLVTLAIGAFFGLRYGSNPLADPAGLLPVVFSAVQLAGFLALAMFIAVLVRKNGLATLLFFLYIFLIEPLLRSHIPRTVAGLLPSNVLFNLTPSPAPGVLHPGILPQLHALPVVLAYTVVFWLASYVLLRRQDL